MNEVVIDASVLTKCLVPEEHSEAARDLLGQAATLCAPDLLLPEIGNVLWKKVLRGEITVQEAQEIASEILEIPLTLEESAHVLRPALVVACELEHPVYDCLYLALAMAREIPLVTADRRLRERLVRSDFADHVRWVGDL